jgi:hypothetical protein
LGLDRTGHGSAKIAWAGIAKSGKAGAAVQSVCPWHDSTIRPAADCGKCAPVEGVGTDRQTPVGVVVRFTPRGSLCAFGYRCDGATAVREEVLPREIFRHARGFVILEAVPLGVCDKCGRKYYAARTLHRVEELALGRAPADRTESVPVARA